MISMKQRILFLIIALLMAVLVLSGMSLPRDLGGDDDNDNSSVAAALSAYKAFTEQEDHADEWIYTIESFGLYDLNQDGIPELFTHGGGQMDYTKIFTYANGSVDYVHWGTDFELYDNGIIYYGFGGGMGYLLYTYYRLGKNDSFDIVFRYAEWMDAEGITYSVGENASREDSERVPHEQIAAQLDKILGNSQIIEIEYYENTAENRDKVFDYNGQWAISSVSVSYTDEHDTMGTFNFQTELSAEELTDPVEYNRNMAMFCGILSRTAEDTDGSSITKIYTEQLGINPADILLGDKSGVEHYGDSLSYSIASMQLGENSLLFITARGSMTTEELLNDYATGVSKDNFMRSYSTYNLMFTFHEKIWDGLNYYMEKHAGLSHMENLKIIVCGHSLGGAAANLVAARINILLDRGELYADVMDKNDVFCYTFGAIDSVSQYTYEAELSMNLGGRTRVKKVKCDYDLPIEQGFENIHNIYNLCDSFAQNSVKVQLFDSVGNVLEVPGGLAFTITGKFGHLDKFKNDYGETLTDTTNHSMTAYMRAVNDELCAHEYPTGKPDLIDGKHGIIACPVDVSVFYKDELIGAINNDKLAFLKDDSIILYAVEDVKHFIIPDDPDYSVRITATDDGGMIYVLEDLGNGSFEIEMIPNIELSKDAKMCIKSGTLYWTNDKGEILSEVREGGEDLPAEDASGHVIGWTIIIIMLFGASFIIGAVVFIICFSVARKKRRNRGA